MKYDIESKVNLHPNYNDFQTPKILFLGHRITKC